MLNTKFKTFHYIALNQEQKELSGVIEAIDEKGAREKLNDLGLSVISLGVIEHITPPGEAKTVFEFEAIDKNSKKVVGTITADSPAKAYGRLFDEYQLTVIAVRSAGEELDLAALQKEYEKLAPKKAPSGGSEQQTQVQENERRELLEKIDYTMQRVESFLKDYGEDLKMEERGVVQGYLNQLLRIKSSTNLGHIRTTCEKMLEHLQKQELFINEGEKTSQSTKIKVETKEMLSELKRTGLQKEIHFSDIVGRLGTNRILKPLADAILRLTGNHSPEIKNIQAEIKTVNRHLWEYLKLLFTGSSKQIRIEAWQTIRTMREEKKRLRWKLNALLAEEKKALANTHPTGYYLGYIEKICGFLFSVYFASYLISYPFTTKQIGGFSIDKIFFFYSSRLLKLITIFLFLIYGALKIRTFWMKQSWFAPYILIPFTIFIYLLIAINLL